MAKGQVLRAVELPVSAVESPAPEPLRLDIGCGKTKMDGWLGIDSLDFGQGAIANLAQTPWKLKAQNGANFPGVATDDCRWTLLDESVSEVRSSHFVEHLTGTERIAFFNELYRVMKPGATAQIVTPNWSHACAYGDPTHQWPPMSQWYPLYLNKAWRDVNAPHAPYTCDFDHVVAGSWDQAIEGRNAEHKQFAMNSYTNAWRDLIVTITKRA